MLCPLGDLRVLGQELLERGHLVRLRVRGQSMRPAIRDGQVLWLSPATVSSLQRGDVVLYVQATGRPIIHRIVHRRYSAGEWHFFIAADYASVAGEWVLAAQVLGRVVALERAGRRISLEGWRGRLWGWAFLLLRPLRPLRGRLRRIALRLAGGPYALLRASGLARRLWRPRLERVQLATPEGPLVKYVHRGRTVAAWYPGTGRFWCRKPYDLVIDRPAGEERGHE